MEEHVGVIYKFYIYCSYVFFNVQPAHRDHSSDMAQVERQEHPAPRSQGGMLDWQQRPNSPTPPISS